MALLTSAAKALVVLVILRMTSDTRLALLNSVGRRRIVARATLKPGMGAIKLKVSLFIVIKQPNFPVVRRVALFTVRPKRFFVSIIIGVTAVTTRIGIFKSRR